MSTLVSIVIPAFNSERWLAETLDSVLSQTYGAFEVVVVDDGSTDGTAGVAHRYADRGVRLVSQQNRGLSGARNAALPHLRGEFIQFLDADDLLSPDKIEAQIRMLEAAPPGTLATCRWARFRLDPARARFGASPLWRDFDPDEYLAASARLAAAIPVHGWLIPQRVLRAAGPFDESIRTTEDLEFFTRAVLHSTGVRFCPQGFALYRTFHQPTLSRARDSVSAESLLRSAQAMERTWMKLRPGSVGRRASANQFQRVAYTLYPEHSALVAEAEAAARRLGGADLKLPMGKLARRLARWVGWKPVQRLRAFLWRRGIFPGRRHFVHD